MNTEKIALGISVVAVVIAAFVLILQLQLNARLGLHSLGAASTIGTNLIPTVLTGGSAPSVVNALEATESFISDGPIYQLGILNRGSSVTGTLLGNQVSNGACLAASSTAFSILNPFAASSTASVVILNSGTLQATSTNYQVGTSTQATGLTTTLVSSSLINSTVATATPSFYIGSGINAGSGAISGGSTNTSVVVGPSERVSMFATSTYGTTGAINYVNSGCTYKINWTN